MWIKTDDFDKQLQRLKRVVLPELFKYVIVQHNHGDIKKDIVSFLHDNFPSRSLVLIKTRETDYFQLVNQIEALNEGFVIIEDYEFLINNEAFARAFNQRRDKLSAKNIAYICFLPNDDNLLKKCRELIPDWWSFRSVLLNFEVEFVLDGSENEDLHLKKLPSLGGVEYAEKMEELEWLEGKINALPENEENLKLELLFKVSDICNELNLAKKLFETCQKMEEIAIQIDLKNTDHTKYALIMNAFGMYYESIGDFNEAANKHENALSIIEHDEKNIYYFVFKNNLANNYSSLGKKEIAISLLEEAVKNAIETFGVNNELVAKYKSNLGHAYYSLFDFEKAKKLFEEALESDIINFGAEHIEVAKDKSNLATTIGLFGQQVEARKLLESAYKIYLRAYGENHPNTKNTKELLGDELFQEK